MAKAITVFVGNHHLSPIGIQILVGFTTLLVVIRFGLDIYRHRSNNVTMRSTLLALDAATLSLLQYSLGAMKEPSVKNSYYQVWAVLLVTLRYSVKHGRPAGVGLRQTPLVDLMSSFWAATILRSHAPMGLKAPVWLLWSINSARIIHGFVSVEHANASNTDNIRLVTEYMREEHLLQKKPLDPVTMQGYKYLVRGEDKQGKKVRPPHYRLELKLTRQEKLITLDKVWEWADPAGGRDQEQISAHRKRVRALLTSGDGRLKDLCLSFALYKLLRRRFYNLPIHEQKLDKTKSLLFDGILCQQGSGDPSPIHESKVVKKKPLILEAMMCCCQCKGSGREADSSPIHESKVVKKKPLILEAMMCCCQCKGSGGKKADDTITRAFRVTKAELSFLNDFFYSRHALIFAQGFPFLRLLLSTLLLGAIGYMAYAIHDYSRNAKLDELGRSVHVHHGVVFTWILLTMLGAKEIIEVAGYVLSDWTKVLLVCNYAAQQPWWLRGWVMEKLVRLLCKGSFIVKSRHVKMGQYNLIFGRRRKNISALTDLTTEVEKAVLQSLRSLISTNPSKEPYLDKALNALQLSAAHTENLREKVDAKVKALVGDVHRILLWHIATCYCELHLADKRKIGVTRPWWVRVPSLLSTLLLLPLYYLFPPCVVTAILGPSRNMNKGIWTAPFVKYTELGNIQTAYLTAISLSQYCAHLLRLDPPLIPGNEILNRGVLERVILETNLTLWRCHSISATFARLQGQNKDILLKMGSELGQILIKEIPNDETGDNSKVLWEFLQNLWTGFLIHLAQSTRAHHHKLHMRRGGELITHVWALLSHAGLMGDVEHGELGNNDMADQEAQGLVYDNK